MSRRSILAKTALAVSTGLVLFSFGQSASAVEAPVNLGTTASYSVLAGSTVTNTGPSVLAGDLGLSPGTSVTGFPPGTVLGTQHVTDAAAGIAQSDLTIAMNDAASRTTSGTFSVLGSGQTLSPGVYDASSSLQLNGALTLDAGGDSSAVFIFRAGSTLTTASASSVLLTNGTQACNVFWLVGSSATIGTTTDFKGTIMAVASVTANTGATFEGRALASTAAVTLDTNVFTAPGCNITTPSPSASESSSASASASEETATPTLPNTGIELWIVWLVGLAIFAGIVTYLFGHLKRRRNSNGS